MVGDNASDDIRAQQLIWNVQSRTPATLRMLRGAQPLDPEEWRKIVVPTLIVVGEEVLPFHQSTNVRTKLVHRQRERRSEHG